MTAFNFMVSGLYILIGTVAIGLAVVIVYGIVAGIRNHIKGKGRTK